MSRPRAPDLVMPDAAGPQRRRRWFSAAGEHWLAIDALEASPTEGLDALRDALLLGEHDALLRRLERIAGRELEWRPAEQDLVSGAPDFTLALRRAAGASDAPGQGSAMPASSAPRIGIASSGALHAQLEAAAGALADGGPAPSADDGVALVPRFASGTLVLGRLALDEADAHRLGPGALVLLPGSFGPRWDAELDAAIAGRLPVRIDASESMLVPEPATPDAGDDGREHGTEDAGRDDGGVRCTVRLETALRVPLARWALGGAGSGLPLRDALADGAAGVAELADGRAYRGELLRVGRGRALRLSSDARG